MPKVFLAILACLATLGLAPAVAHSAPRTTPTQMIAVSGSGVGMYPAFSTSIHRYAITTDDTTAGTVQVTASTSAKSGSIWIDGQPVASGTETLTGLSSGDEISVFIKSSKATSVYSLIYVPAGFPTMSVTTMKAGIAPGYVFLTPSDFTGGTPSFETAVDNYGVPIYVRKDPGVPLDFKRQPNGDYSVARSPALGTQSGDQIDELNSRFKEIAQYQTEGGLTDTDGHDSILLANGDRWLIATEPNSNTMKWDGVIQEQSPTGKVLFQWSSGDHGLDAVSMFPGSVDYAHLNSIWLMKNGDILASFRHLSQVMEIATHAHNGFKKGDIVWSLGGRYPTLKAVDDPDQGPCAQHSASQLPNGDILMFDDGSESIDGSGVLCPDYNDPASGPVARPQTRVAEYKINQTKKTATLVWSFQITGRDSNFEGSAQRLSNGDTMIGWGPNTAAIATEVNADKQVVWELKANNGLFSYRALKFPAPDKIPPVVDVTTPVNGATYTYGENVDSDFSCTDRGGSNLQSCAGSVTEGAPIDTTASGTHTFTVTAKDGAGNTTTVKRTYRVVGSPYRPDAMIKPVGGHYTGAKIYNAINAQTITQSISSPTGSAKAVVKVCNRSAKPDRLVVRGSAGSAKFGVRYYDGSRDITKAVEAGTFRTPTLAPGAALTLSVIAKRTTHAKAGNERKLKLTVSSAHDSGRTDAVATVIRAKH
ncbi:MAG TPA: aryl-sulfate sulfotransferase [Mycobacteriales bacterium]|nr:aryl-sulfate sulfotransferase [Mycobacteriales bacterium]